MSHHRKFIDNILTNYQQLEKSIVQQLYFQSSHGPTTGSFRESVWKDLFEFIVPKKFVVEQSVFIVDSNGGISKEADLAIIDELYTPYIFRQGELKFVPIEAVSAVVQCKSSRADEADLSEWLDSIQQLKTNNEGIARLQGIVTKGPKEGSPSTQTDLRPITIYCHLDGAKVNEDRVAFDLTIHANQEKESLVVTTHKDMKSLDHYYYALNHNLDHEEVENIAQNQKCVNDHKEKNKENRCDEANQTAKIALGGLNDKKLKDLSVFSNGEEVSILSLNLKLNQLLMLINNPPFFPHYAYAKMFSDGS